MTIDSGLGVCGYNSIYTLQDQRPTCACPKGYSLLDPNDLYGNCKPDFIQGCEEDKLSPTNDIYEVQMLTNTDWPLSDFMQLNPSTPESCNQSCFEDCLCAVAIYRVETCWKKKLPLSNGRVDNGLNSQAFIKVRKGCFGVVYKGILQIGSGVPVAVKKLNFVVQDSEKEFKTELNIIGQTHHKNLVRLVGYCDEGQERLLVYEFLSNGTLANFLFAEPSWKQRIDIAYGVAKGLLYLHEECNTQIIH
ncbi:putative protein kinase RLK-Pelle-SD-2b family [Rosa chinensis]|nr:putative protein kinase RLK-Pelle-SD-2b family [Rosa chinensis]